MGLKIVGLGHCPGKRTVPNEEITRLTGLSNDWIIERTGIHSRHHTVDQVNAQMGAEAAEKAIKNAGISKEDIGACILATFTPDMMTPTTACTVAGYLGLSEGVVTFDVNGACAGFLCALNTAEGVLKNSNKRYALVLGSEYISKIIDWNNQKTCSLFGDGSGCVVVEIAEDNMYFFSAGCQPDKDILYCNTINPSIEMNGREVFRFAVDVIPKTMDILLQKADLILDDIDYVVCHQANARIINYVIKHLGASPDKFYINIDHYGNTSAASIPIALSEMSERNLLKAGQKIICVGFGGGLSYGGILMTI